MVHLAPQSLWSQPREKLHQTGGLESRLNHHSYLLLRHDVACLVEQHQEDPMARVHLEDRPRSGSAMLLKSTSALPRKRGWASAPNSLLHHPSLLLWATEPHELPSRGSLAQLLPLLLLLLDLARVRSTGARLARHLLLGPLRTRPR